MTKKMEIQFSLCAFFQQAADCHQMGAVILLHGGREPDESDPGRGKASLSELSTQSC